MIVMHAMQAWEGLVGFAGFVEFVGFLELVGKGDRLLSTLEEFKDASKNA